MSHDTFTLDLAALGAMLAMAGLPDTVSTAQAARMLKRTPQTLRRWAAKRQGPIQPVRINGRLHWRTTDIMALLNGGVPSSHVESGKEDA